MRDQRSQGDIWGISWCKHVGTNDGKIRPQIPNDKKVSYTFGLEDRFKIKPLGHRLLKYWCT